MAWGILETRTSHHVPGTVLLQELRNDETHFTNLKTINRRSNTIVLVPQPSDDLNDPLNWPLWMRDLITLLFGYCALLVVGGIGPILSSLTLELEVLFDVSYTKISLLTRYSLCATGASGVFISAIANKYGKRFVLLFSMACTLAGTIWGGCSTTYNSLLGARILQGLSVSLFESVVFSVIGDLYYVHERGTPGKISMTLGWRWVFWLLAIFLGAGFGLSLLFGWETAYRRDAIYDTDLASQDNLDYVDVKGAVQRDSSHVESTKEADGTQTARAGSSSPRKSFLQRLNPASGEYTAKPLWRLVIDPFIVLANPAVIWAVLLISFPTLWLVAINLLVAQIFASPPYLLDTAHLGYVSAGPAVGGVLGALIAGAVSDPIIEWAARRSKGVYEPEFRLALIIPALVTSAIAYLPFGYLTEQGKGLVFLSTLWGFGAASLQKKC